MSQDLVLHFRPDGGLIWSMIDRVSGARLRHGEAGPGEIPDTGETAEVSRTLCLLPTEHVFLTRISLPARSEREARQAAPFMIEDELAAGLDETRVVIGEKDAGNERWVMAVDEARAEAWLAALEPVLVRPVHTVPDCLAIPSHDAVLRLHDRGDAVLVMLDGEARESGRNVGAAVSRGLFDTLLPALVKQAGEGQIAVSASLGLAGANLTALDHEDLDRGASRLDDEFLKGLPSLFGDRLRSTFDWSSVLRPLRRPAMLAGAALLGFGLLMGGEAIYLRHQADRFDDASVVLFRQSFPEVTTTLVPASARRILDQRLAGVTGNSDGVSFLTLSAALADLTRENDRIRIDHLRFDRSRAELTVSAIYTEFSDFDALSRQAAEMGLVLDDQGTREGDRGIEGDFVLRLR